MATRVRGGSVRGAVSQADIGSSNSYTRSREGSSSGASEERILRSSARNRSRNSSYEYSSAAARGRTKNTSGNNKNVKENTRKKVKVKESVYDDNYIPDKRGIGRIIHDAIFKPAAGEIDYVFLTAVIAILAMGLVMLLSASAPKAKELKEGSTAYYFFIRQLAFAGAGLFGMYVISKMDYRAYRKYAVPLSIIGIVLLIAVLLIGQEHNGAKRWLFGIQPSEFVKPITAMLMAHIITLKKYSMRKPIEFILPAVYIVFVSILMIKEPHVSGVVIILGITMCIMVAAGMPVIPVIIVGIIAGTAVVLGVRLFSPIRWSRITSFLDPFGDQQGTTYQIVQSIYAIGSGGITGRGLGQSLQKFKFLPEPYNDFIFAVVCEELGLLGAIFVMGLFAFLIIRGIKIAMNAPDRYSMLLAVGIVAHVAIQSVLNMAVASGAVPNTGISLPFFSYGGTSLFTLLCEMGVLLNISRYSKR